MNYSCVVCVILLLVAQPIQCDDADDVLLQELMTRLRPLKENIYATLPAYMQLNATLAEMVQGDLFTDQSVIDDALELLNDDRYADIRDQVQAVRRDLLDAKLAYTYLTANHVPQQVQEKLHPLLRFANLDECELWTSCLNGATCEDGIMTRTCHCAAGYAGDDCSIDIDECALHPCLHGATCVDGLNSRTCECAPGYEGDSCEIDIDECQLYPCLNGGTCTDHLNSRSCDCIDGYYGENCGYVGEYVRSCSDEINLTGCQCYFGHYGGGTCEKVLEKFVYVSRSSIPKLHSYDPMSKTWDTKNIRASETIDKHTVISKINNTHLVAVGNQDKSGVVYSINIATGETSTLKQYGGGYQMSTVVAGHYFYMVGGIKINQRFKNRKVYRFDLDNLSTGWQELQGLDYSVSYAVLVANDDAVFIVGSNMGHTKIYRYDVATNEKQVLTSYYGSIYRTQHGAALVNDSLIILFGKTTKIECRLDDSEEPTFTDLPVEGVSRMAAVMYDGEPWLNMKRTIDGVVRYDVARYDVARDQFEVFDDVNAPDDLKYALMFIV